MKHHPKLLTPLVVATMALYIVAAFGVYWLG